MGGPDGAVEEGDGQRRQQARHPRGHDRRPTVVVNGPLEVPDPFREPAVVAERRLPVEPGCGHRFHAGTGKAGEPSSPGIDVVFAAERGERFAGHGPVVDEAVG